MFIAFIALVERTSYVVAFSLRWVIVVLTALVPLVVVVIVVVEHAALEVDLGSCTCTAPTPILAAQGGTQVAYRYLSRLFFVILQFFCYSTILFVILRKFLSFYIFHFAVMFGTLQLLYFLFRSYFFVISWVCFVLLLITYITLCYFIDNFCYL